MNRLPRGINGSGFFHVMVQGINKEYIFEKEEYKKEYLELIINGREKSNIKLLAYCIMDNHAHLLIYTKNVDEMSAYMKLINCRFARFYNKEQKRVGYVFRDRFNSQYINNKNYLLRCLNYIHMNPVNANMVKKPEYYTYSSYNSFINKTDIVTDEIIEIIFGKTEGYLHIFSNISNKEFEIMDVERENKNFEIATKIYLERKELDLNQIKQKKEELIEFCKEIIIKKKYKQKQVANLLRISEGKLSKLMKKMERKKSV